jgi:hypothetical protein
VVGWAPVSSVSHLRSSVNRYFPADKPVRRLKLLTGSLFVLAELTLFLTYFRLEYAASDLYHTPRSTETFTGLQLMTGNYHSKSPHDASDGAWVAYIVALAALIGLATVPSRRNKAMAIVLVIVTLITLVAGCASTSSALDLDLFGGPDEHVGHGFVLGALLLAGATVIRVILWLSERGRAARSGELR